MIRTVPQHGAGLPKRVGFCGFHTGAGGIGHVMINLMNGFVAADCEVDLLIADRSSPHLAALDPRISVVETGTSFWFSTLPAMVRYLQSRCPDWIISNRERTNRLAVLARELSGSRVRVAFRVGNSVTATLAKRNPLKRGVRKGLLAWSYRKADVVIVNSPGLAQDVVAHAGIKVSRVSVLNNPTCDRRVLEQAALPVDHPWFAGEGLPVILGVGRITRQKDFPTLIRAFDLVRRQRPARLVILGEGNDRGAIEVLVKELGLEALVSLPGYVNNPFAYMAKADVFVLSSVWEGSPNVLIQALTVGCPVVATDCPEGPRDILRGGAIAPLVEMGDVEALARAIAQVLDHPPLRSQLQLAAEPYEIDRCVAAYLDVLRSSGPERR